MNKGNVIMMAGGTGGHVFPALAVAHTLRAEGYQVIWLGTPYGLEATVVPENNFQLESINIRGLRRSGLLRLLTAPLTLARALVQSLSVMWRYKPIVVIGMGGFVTGPGGLAAWLLRRPLVIHEQNAVPGLTNRLLSRLATRVLEGFTGAFDKKGVLQTGNPVRDDITKLESPAVRYQQHTGKIHLLVIGGSLGATALNKIIPETISLMDEAERPEVWHQAGKRNIGSAQEHYQSFGVAARVEPFLNDMAAAYEWADLVICRAGALTVAELAAVGTASILVPYPFAVDDHQTQNAMYLVKGKAAVLLPQTDLNPEVLLSSLKGYCSDLVEGRARLLDMALHAKKLAKLEATNDVIKASLEVAHV